MSIDSKKPCVLTIGNFDGVHKGHIALINTAVSFAHDKKYQSEFLAKHKELAQCFSSLSLEPQEMDARIITFSPHPRTILGSKTFAPLMHDDTRLAALKNLYADNIDFILFNVDFAEQSCEDFCKEMVQKYNMKMLFIGHDFRMGCDKAKEDTLREIGSRHGFCVHALEAVTLESHELPPQNKAEIQTPLIVSSTCVRGALQEGQVELAATMLGKPFAISGLVEHGAKRGGDLLGFPTANLKANFTVVPRDGVYATLCKILTPKYEEQIFLGVTNIRNKHTIGGSVKSIETYLLDFNDNLYGLPMEIAFIEFIRKEVKFNSVQELITQITADTNASRKILEEFQKA